MIRPTLTLASAITLVVAVLGTNSCCKVETDEQKCEKATKALFDYVMRCHGGDMDPEQKAELKREFDSEFDCSEKKTQDEIVKDTRDIDKCVSDLKKHSCTADDPPKSCGPSTKKKK